MLMVLLDAEFNATEIWEAERALILTALSAPGSRAWNERGTLAITKFKALGRLRWAREAQKAIQTGDPRIIHSARG